MRLFHSIALLLVESLAFGQGFNRRFDLFGNGFAQGAWGIEKTTAGYCILGSSSDYDSIGPGEYFFHASVVHTFVDANGWLIDERRSWRPIHSAFPGWANCCDTIPGGGFVVGGSSEDTLGNDEVYLMRYNALGDTLWTRVFGVGGQNWGGYQVKHTTDEGFIIVGAYDPNSNVNGFALKTDSAGNEQWRQTYGGGLSDYFVAVHEIIPGSYYIGGQRRITQANKNLWVQRIDSTGGVVWSKLWGGGYDEPNAHLIATSDGHALVASAWGYADDLSLTRPYIAKLDSSDGTILWEHQYGEETYTTILFAVKERTDQSLIACGVSYYGGDQQGLLLRTTSEGDSIWMRSYFYQDTLMQDGTGRFYDVLPTDDGGFIAAGAAYHSATIGYPDGYSQDTWVVKVDSMGCIIPGCDATGVTEIITNLQGALTVWPNPVSSGAATVQIRIDLPASLSGKNDLQLSLLNSTGQLVAQQRAQEGNNTLPLSALPAGLYYVHLTSGKTWLSGTKLVVE
jgi:Secretion system C-terminal sorting domain